MSGDISQGIVFSFSQNFLGQVANLDGLSDHLSLVPSVGMQDARLVQLVQTFDAEVAHGCVSGRLFSESLATAVVVHLLRNYGAHQPKFLIPAEKLTRTELRKALEYIHDNLTENIGLDNIADAACLSVAHFSRLFKQSTGLAVHEYLITARIEKAKALLQGTSDAISQVAHTVGFYDHAHFVRHFKRLTGVTPTQFRQSL